MTDEIHADSLVRKKNERIQKLQGEKDKKDPRPDMVITLALLAVQAELDFLFSRTITDRYDGLEGIVINAQSMLEDVKEWLPKAEELEDA